MKRSESVCRREFSLHNQHTPPYTTAICTSGRAKMITTNRNQYVNFINRNVGLSMWAKHVAHATNWKWDRSDFSDKRMAAINRISSLFDFFFSDRKPTIHHFTIGKRSNRIPSIRNYFWQYDNIILCYEFKVTSARILVQSMGCCLVYYSHTPFTTHLQNMNVQIASQCTYCVCSYIISLYAHGYSCIRV